MNTRWYKLALLLFVFVLASVLMYPSSSLLPAARAQSNGVIHSATGSGHVGIWDGQPYWDNFVFSALQRVDGRVSGEVRYTDKVIGLRVAGEVYDLVVEGNMAKISYLVKRPATKPDVPEEVIYGFFVVIDGGEGESASPDMISWLIGATEEGCPCGNPPPETWTPVEKLKAFSPQEFLNWLKDINLMPELFVYIRGNVQVR